MIFVHFLHNLSISLDPPMEGSKLKNSPIIEVPGLLGQFGAGKPCNNIYCFTKGPVNWSFMMHCEPVFWQNLIYIYIYNDVLWMNLGHENHTNTKSLLQFHNWTCLLAIFVIPQKLHGWLVYHVFVGSFPKSRSGKVDEFCNFRFASSHTSCGSIWMNTP